MSESKRALRNEVDENNDPITGEHGAHPVGAGVGAAVGGAAAGAAAGMVGGPVGTVAGAIIGGIVGGLAGKSVAEQIDPTVESAYWADEYSNRPYYSEDVAYDHVEPAYRYGWESRAKHDGSTYEDIRPQLAADWDEYRQDATDLDWQAAEPAARDAWERIETGNHLPRKPK